MNRIIQILKKASLKDIAILSSGVMIAQIISLIFQPFITRIYGEENIGKLALYTSTLSMFLPVFTLQYDVCIVGAQSDEDADTLTALSIYLGLAISMLVSVGVIIYNIINPQTFKEIGLSIYTYVFLFCLTVLSSVATNWNNRHKQYKLISKVSIISTATSNIVKIGMGLLGFGFVGLVVSYFISLTVGLKVKSKYILENFRTIFIKKPEVFLKCAKKYKNQPLFSLPGLFLVTFSYSILAFIINQIYGVKELGYYSLSVAMLGLPFSLISESISKVFYKNASVEFVQKKTIKESFKNSSALLVLVAIPMFVVLYFVAEPAFSFVFGNDWFRSGSFAKILIPMFFVRFLTSGLITGLIIIEKQLAKFIIQAFFIISTAISWVITTKYSLPIESFLTMISYSYAIVYAAIYLLLFKESFRKDRL